MFIKELRLSISPLAKIGFKVGESYPPLVAENDAHRVTAFLQDRETFAIIDIALKTVARCTVDGYSVIAYFNPKGLSAFIDSDSELTEGQIVPFIIGNLTGDCRDIFNIVKESTWMDIYEFHCESLRRRNETFWATVSGYRSTYPFKSGRRYAEAPKPTW